MSSGATALTPNQALEQTRDSVLRNGEQVGRELLNFVVIAKLWLVLLHLCSSVSTATRRRGVS